ncbi:MAG: oligoribonuclease [Myxococcales bacterium]|nr:oligoribonuclease [Myxococcales bacterium]
MTNKHQEKWVWVDLEMTGLDPETCVIIEVAVIVTDTEFNEEAQYEGVIWQPDERLEEMIPFVKQMHTANGLIQKVKKSQLQLEQAEDAILEMLKANVAEGKGLLAGNSVWQDRRFLTKYMPKVEAYLHYRQIDVSSLKVLASAWHPKDGSPPNKSSNHTALSDIRASMQELQFYRGRFFESSAS